MQGSSPRMRGTLTFTFECNYNAGIIPAHARNTDFYFRVQLQCRDHPRACGEHFLSRQKLPTVPGSSPRMRGTRFVPWQVRVGCGIIPAHAGNTVDPFPKRRRPEDHPRACGEHPRLFAGQVDGPGSSPRMRGTPATPMLTTCRIGIIPAHAGNTKQQSPAD